MNLKLSPGALRVRINQTDVSLLCQRSTLTFDSGLSFLFKLILVDLTSEDLTLSFEQNIPILSVSRALFLKLLERLPSKKGIETTYQDFNGNPYKLSLEVDVRS